MPPLSPLAHVARGDPVKARAVRGKGVLYLKYAAMALRAGGLISFPRYNPTDKICRSFVNYKKVRRKTIFQFVKMIIRLLSHTFFMLTFITSSGIFGYFGDLQYLEIPNFPNIRTQRAGSSRNGQ